MNARAAVASQRADDEVVYAAETLIIRGKEEGRLPPDDVLQGLPAIEAEPDQLERVFQVFREMGIEVSDSDGDAADADEKDDDEVVNTEAVDTFSLDDPIRMYLKEIGRVALLRKEQEVDYARLIELGDDEARDKLTEANLRLVVSAAQAQVHPTAAARPSRCDVKQCVTQPLGLTAARLTLQRDRLGRLAMSTNCSHAALAAKSWNGRLRRPVSLAQRMQIFHPGVATVACFQVRDIVSGWSATERGQPAHTSQQSPLVKATLGHPSVMSPDVYPRTALTRLLPTASDTVTFGSVRACPRTYRMQQALTTAVESGYCWPRFGSQMSSDETMTRAPTQLCQG